MHITYPLLIILKELNLCMSFRSHTKRRIVCTASFVCPYSFHSLSLPPTFLSFLLSLLLPSSFPPSHQSSCQEYLTSPLTLQLSPPHFPPFFLHLTNEHKGKFTTKLNGKNYIIERLFCSLCVKCLMSNVEVSTSWCSLSLSMSQLWAVTSLLSQPMPKN